MQQSHIEPPQLMANMSPSLLSPYTERPLIYPPVQCNAYFNEKDEKQYNLPALLTLSPVLDGNDTWCWGPRCHLVCCCVPALKVWVLGRLMGASKEGPARVTADSTVVH